MNHGCPQGPVSQKSRNFSGLFWVPQFSLYLRNADVLSQQTSQFSLFFLPLKLVKRSAFQNNNCIAVWQLAFWAQKVLGTFKKQAPDIKTSTKSKIRQLIYFLQFVVIPNLFSLRMFLQKGVIKTSFYQFSFDHNSSTSLTEHFKEEMCS